MLDAKLSDGVSGSESCLPGASTSLTWQPTGCLKYTDLRLEKGLIGCKTDKKHKNL